MGLSRDSHKPVSVFHTDCSCWRGKRRCVADGCEGKERGGPRTTTLPVEATGEAAVGFFFTDEAVRAFFAFGVALGDALGDAFGAPSGAGAASSSRGSRTSAHGNGVGSPSSMTACLVAASTLADRGWLVLR